MSEKQEQAVQAVRELVIECSELRVEVTTLKDLVGKLKQRLLRATDCTGTTHFNCIRCKTLAEVKEAGL